MGGPVFNIVFNSLSYLIMYFCFKLRSKYLWSPVPPRSYLQQAAPDDLSDELRMSCERSLQLEFAVYRGILFVSGGVEFLLKGYFATLQNMYGPVGSHGVGYLALTIRSIRLGLNVQTFRLAIHLNLFSRRLCCTMRNRRRALRSSHSPPDSNLAVFSNRITRQKHLTHLSRVISLPNHDVCLEYSQTLYEFG